MPIIVIAWQFAVGIFTFVASLPREVLYPLLTAGGLLFFYEGISIPTFWPVSLIWEGSIIDGRVDRVRNEADARCELRIQKSIEAATKTDSAINVEQMSKMQVQIEEANERALAQQRLSKDYQDEISGLSAALQVCRKATPADRARLGR